MSMYFLIKLLFRLKRHAIKYYDQTWEHIKLHCLYLHGPRRLVNRNTLINRSHDEESICFNDFVLNIARRGKKKLAFTRKDIWLSKNINSSLYLINTPTSHFR